MASNPATDDPTPGAWLDERRSGVLLHLTSLPGAGACGDLGEHAYYFVESSSRTAGSRSGRCFRSVPDPGGALALTRPVRCTRAIRA